MTESKDCFVVSPIGEEGSDVRERADKLLKYVIKPSVQEYGYEPIRADQIAEPGLITSQVIEYVVESPLVVADLSNSNPNVFYELAVRHASQKPLIQLIRKGDDIPFDVAGTRTIHLKLDDIESVEQAKEQIQNQIETIEEGTRETETPISVALNLKQLRESTDPEDRSLAEIMDLLTNLHSDIATVHKMLNDPENILPPDYMQKISHNNTLEFVREIEVLTRELEDTARMLFTKIEKSDDLTKQEIEPIRKDILRLIDNLNKERDKFFHSKPSTKSLDDF